jgi:hypothetical protein
MKKSNVLVVLALVSTLFTSPIVEAHGFPRYSPAEVHAIQHGYYNPNNFRGAQVINNYRGGGAEQVLIPMAIGGVVGYIIGDRNSNQKETVIVREQTQVQVPVESNEAIYKYENVYDQSCKCNKKVLVKIN